MHKHACTDGPSPRPCLLASPEKKTSKSGGLSQGPEEVTGARQGQWSTTLEGDQTSCPATCLGELQSLCPPLDTAVWLRGAALKYLGFGVLLPAPALGISYLPDLEPSFSLTPVNAEAGLCFPHAISSHSGHAQVTP